MGKESPGCNEIVDQEDLINPVMPEGSLEEVNLWTLTPRMKEH